MIPERRSTTRFKMNLPVKIHNSSGDKAVDVGRATNISAGGLSMETNKFFKPDQRLVVRFLINAESTTSIPTKVVWSEDEHGDRRCGVKFLITH